MKKQLTTWIILTCVFLLASTLTCSATEQQSQDELLRKRVEELMQAKADGKWDVVYGLYNANFRNAVPGNSFANKPRTMRFKSFTIEKLEILPSGTEAVVEVKSNVEMQGFEFKGALNKQHWIKEGEQWFQKVRPKANPFAPTKVKGNPMSGNPK